VTLSCHPLKILELNLNNGRVRENVKRRYEIPKRYHGIENMGCEGGR